MSTTPKFCSNCGTALNDGAKFCHGCGAAVGGAVPSSASASTPASKASQWTIPVLALIAVIALVVVQFNSSPASPASGAGGAPPFASMGSGSAPDLSTMSPTEQADRLFNRVMRLWSEGKTDSAAFFAPMALGALEALSPLDNHRHYDIGLVALVAGNTTMAAAEADTILKSRPNHLLGLSLAARAADAAKQGGAAAEFRRKLVAAEASETAAALPEYQAHANDIKEAVAAAKKR